LREKKEGIIFLEKIITNKDYYSRSYKSKLKKGRFISETKFLNGKKIINKRVDDDQRRVKDLKRFILNKNICDFGCGFGGFLLKSKPFAKKTIGIELGKNCRNYLNKKKIINFKDINEYSDKFDLITLFHTLHYIPDQIKTLKNLKSKLNKKGKVIIEVPHANDILLKKDVLPEFKQFSFCKESLIWHTEKSLKLFLKKSGFKKIKIKLFQRYELENHMGWYLYRKPGGHEFFKNKIGNDLKNSYKKFIKKNKLTDSLIAIASI
jgi:SAM-dependent methyltransferase